MGKNPKSHKQGNESSNGTTLDVSDTATPSGMSTLFYRIGRLIAIYGALYLLMEIASEFGIHLITARFLRFWLFLSVGMNIFVITEWVLFSKKKTIEVVSTKQSFAEALVDEVQQLATQKKFDEVLRYREHFSHFLWVEGKLDERIKIGQIAEDAAAKLGRTEEQASALIDDLGWTHVAIKKYSKAEQYLRHGLRLASELQNHHWQAKAHRHLAGMYIEAGAFDNSKRELQSALNAANNIGNEKEKKKMIAGIEYGAAITAFNEGDLKTATSHLETSRKLRQEVGDETRIVRIFALQGKIAEAQGDMDLAKDHYRKGLSEAERIGRTDEVIRNHLGLARIYAAEGDEEKAEAHKQKASKLLESTPIPYEIEDNQAELVKLKRRP